MNNKQILKVGLISINVITLIIVWKSQLVNQYVYENQK